MMDEITNAIASGVKVVVTTSSEEGQVHTSYDDRGSAFDLYKRGAILGRDHDSLVQKFVDEGKEYMDIS